MIQATATNQDGETGSSLAIEDIRGYNQALFGQSEHWQKVGDLLKHEFPEVSLSERIGLVPNEPITYLGGRVNNPTFTDPHFLVYTDGKVRPALTGEAQDKPVLRTISQATFILCIRVWDTLASDEQFLVDGLLLGKEPNIGEFRRHLKSFKEDFPYAVPFPFHTGKRAGIVCHCNPPAEEAVRPPVIPLSPPLVTARAQ